VPSTYFSGRKEFCAEAPGTGAFRELDESTQPRRGAIEIDDEGDLDLWCSGGDGERRTGDFERWFAFHARTDLEVREFRKKKFRCRAEARTVRMPNDARRVRVIDEVACVVGSVGPTCPGTRIGERGFTGAGIAAEQDASAVFAYAGGMQVSDDRRTEQKIDDLLEKVIAEIRPVFNRLLCYPGEAYALLEIKESLVFSVCDKGVKVVVLTPGGLRRTGGACTLADSDADGQGRPGMGLACMTEGFECGEKDVETVGEDPDWIAEGIEGVDQRQIKGRKQRVLRPGRGGVVHGVWDVRLRGLCTHCRHDREEVMGCAGYKVSGG